MQSNLIPGGSAGTLGLLTPDEAARFLNVSKSWLDKARVYGGGRHERVGRHLMKAAGISMEDACPVAIIVHPPDRIATGFDELERATSDANLLIKAARILAARDIR